MRGLPGEHGMLPSMPSLDALPSRHEDELTASLIAGARTGDQDAWSRLVEIHLGRVWRVVWKIVRHDQDAEDVSQEVFLTAWQSLADFRGDARFTTWVHTIAVTRALNHVDRAAERMRRASESLAQETEAEEGREMGADVERAAAKVYSVPPSPLEQLAAGELMRRLARCLERLPGAWRAVLALREAEDRSYEEIAVSLGLAIGTVRSRLARARIALKDCVEGSAP